MHLQSIEDFPLLMPADSCLYIRRWWRRRVEARRREHSPFIERWSQQRKKTRATLKRRIVHCRWTTYIYVYICSRSERWNQIRLWKWSCLLVRIWLADTTAKEVYKQKNQSAFTVSSSEKGTLAHNNNEMSCPYPPMSNACPSSSWSDTRPI